VKNNFTYHLRYALKLKKLTLDEVLMNKSLASLGDAFVNFIYSLALSEKRMEASGAKVKSQTLAEALRNTGFREYLPSRTDRHTQGDAAEALIVYSWLQDLISLEETISIISKQVEEPVKAFSTLLNLIRNKLLIEKR